MILLIDNVDESKVSYIVISEDITRIGSDNTLILNPFIRKSLVLPTKLSFAVAIGIKINNENLESAIMRVLDPSDKILVDIDLKEMYFEEDRFFNENNTRIGKIFGATLELTNSSGFNIEMEGEYYIKVLVNDQVLGESFFNIVNIAGESDE